MTTAYQGMTRMCLNNWHYINEKVLSFNTGINFFTGHSGSGKSTVLDALQLMLYVDTNGRGFFNKAAKDDSDRSLMEYLRGMKVVSENDEAGYLRNQNFSTTIVLEFTNTQTGECQCMGVVFDVDVAANDADRMFFWHKGKLFANHYRVDNRAMSINELKDYLRANYTKEQWDFSRTNEKFRVKMYDTYLGGLDEKKFPALFKKAIPFRMNMKLEDFVKNYICMEKNIHIEDMQDSVVQYVRLRRRLEDTKNEIALLTEIKKQYEKFRFHWEHSLQYQYNIDKLDIYSIEKRLEEIQEKQIAYKEDLLNLEESTKTLENEIESLQKQRDEVMIAIENSGFSHLESELRSVNQVLEFLNNSKNKYDKIAQGLENWLDYSDIDTDSKANIVKFINYKADTAIIVDIKNTIADIQNKILERKAEVEEKVRILKNQILELEAEILELEEGKKAYPSYVIEAKNYIEGKLTQKYGTNVQVDILADIIEVADSKWQNAVEGYMANNKLSLIVSPEYSKAAIEIYDSMDAKRFHKVSVIDSERVMKASRTVLDDSLANEVVSDVDYAKAYVDFLMGSVVKCGKIDELRQNKNAITPDCVLYHNYKIQHINPKNYTDYACIGKGITEERIQRDKRKLDKLSQEIIPLKETIEEYNRLLKNEALNDDVETYEKYLTDIVQISEKNIEKENIEKRIEELKTFDINAWKQKKELLEREIKAKSATKELYSGEYRGKSKALKDFTGEVAMLNSDLVIKEKSFNYDAEREKQFQTMIKERANERIERIKNDLASKKITSDNSSNVEYEKLILVRDRYSKEYSFRGFNATSRENTDYDNMLARLESDKLQEFTEKANDQAKIAIHHFKTDFIYKIRDSIREAMQQKDELNEILAQSDFGKEKYRFTITKNKGEDGKFYDMFMDENLEVNPTQLSNHMENQIDMFSQEHSENYKDLINELIEIFMPPDNSDAAELEEARHNMEKYADYRTYLSFDMEQLIDGMPPMKLSKMLSKNSGGEGQNPLYIALLASFAQVYKVNAKENSKRKPTMRLVVLDEAFSKMDGEKVGSCVELIRKMGFQAIISATNDKLQNYVDYVDKTFVFANPNKNHISIQPFEKREFQSLLDIAE